MTELKIMGFALGAVVVAAILMLTKKKPEAKDNPRTNPLNNG